MTEKKAPEVIEDDALDETSGGLPNMQKVRDPTSNPTAAGPYTGATPVIGGVLNNDTARPKGDGSV
jgi:hypothetical protein